MKTLQRDIAHVIRQVLNVIIKFSAGQPVGSKSKSNFFHLTIVSYMSVTDSDLQRRHISTRLFFYIV